MALLVFSALAVIKSKYHSRLLFIAIQSEEKKLNDYGVAWGKLQLELTMLMEGNRIELVAKKKLKLVAPQQQDIIYLKR